MRRALRLAWAPFHIALWWAMVAIGLVVVGLLVLVDLCDVLVNSRGWGSMWDGDTSHMFPRKDSP